MSQTTALFRPLYLQLELTLFSAGNLGIPAFRKPQGTHQLQHTSYLTFHYNSLHQPPRMPSTDRAFRPPRCWVLKGQSMDRTLPFLFHFMPPKTTDNSKTFPRVRARYTNCRQPTGTALTLKNTCTYWLKIRKLFEFLQLSNTDYHHRPIPVTCPTWTCSPFLCARR